MPRGGKRPGAGRPPGSKNTLPLGAVRVLNAARVAERRLAGLKDATQEDKAIVERVFERVGEVLEGKVDAFRAGHVLKAGAMVADAVAGPQVQKVQHSLAGQHAAMVFAVIAEETAQAANAQPQLEQLPAAGGTH